jgi:peptide deformylase
MAIMKIYTMLDPELRVKAEPVAAVTPAIVQQMQDMLETMYAHEGIGLAATQVGLKNRVLVIDLQEKEGPRTILRMANPEILEMSEEPFTYQEGCLSVPGHYADVTRPRHVRVAYLDEKNQRQELAASDLLAICIQHEIDHLNGIVFVDHLSRLKRDMITKKMEKAADGVAI